MTKFFQVRNNQKVPYSKTFDEITVAQNEVAKMKEEGIDSWITEIETN